MAERTAGLAVTAKILQFPVQVQEAPQTCDQCIFFMEGGMGMHCMAYNETIFSVNEGNGCELYEAP